MHVILSHQLVTFIGLISFYFYFFNDMHFTHDILLVGSNVGRYRKIKNKK